MDWDVSDDPELRHDPRYRVCTNDPAYDAQLENLRRYAPFGGELDLPGEILATDRFVRASYFLHYLPEPVSVEEAVAGAVLVSRNVWVPPGATYDDFSGYPTWWGSAAERSGSDQPRLLLPARHQPEPALDRARRARARSG